MLIRLELKKHRLNHIGIGFVMTGLFMTLVILLITKELLVDYTQMFHILDVMISAYSVVLASVLFDKMIIRPINKRHFLLMQTYPVSFNQLLLAKTLIIIGLSVALSYLMYLSVVALVFLGQQVILGTTTSLGWSMFLKSQFYIIMAALIFSLVGLIPSYVGCRLRSSGWTIAMGVILSVGLTSYSEDAWLVMINTQSISLALIGILSYILTIRHLKHIK